MIKIISARTNQVIKDACSLKNSKERKARSLFLSEGKKNFEMALEAGLVTAVFTLSEIKGLNAKITQYIVTPEIIEKLSSYKNPEPLIFIARSKEETIPEIHNKLLYLENIADPGNMGTIIRTALALNYDAIFLSDNCVDVYNEKVVAASKGAIFKMPIIKDNPFEMFKEFKLIVSCLTDDAIEIKQCQKVEKFILALGNEARGVSQELLNKADIRVKIPMKDIDSLNVAVAAGILMYHLN